jgi:hypothetical protein
MKTSFLFILSILLISGGCSPKVEQPLQPLVDSCEYITTTVRTLDYPYLRYSYQTTKTHNSQTCNSCIKKKQKDDETDILIKNLKFKR